MMANRDDIADLQTILEDWALDHDLRCPEEFVNHVITFISRDLLNLEEEDV